MTAIEQSVKAELAIRDQLSKQILDIVFTKYEIGYGYGGRFFVKRGPLQDFVYNSLGFYGRPRRSFRVFVNKVMVEAGFRTAKHGGYCTFAGLRLKNPETT